MYTWVGSDDLRIVDGHLEMHWGFDDTDEMPTLEYAFVCCDCDSVYDRDVLESWALYGTPAIPTTCDEAERLCLLARIEQIEAARTSSQDAL